MENYKLFDAYRCFISGWVQIIKHVTRNSIFITKCELDFHVEHQTIPMFHGLPFFQLELLLLSILLLWLGKNTYRLLNYILESETKDYFLLLFFFFSLWQYNWFFVFSDIGRHVFMLLLCSAKLKTIRSGIAEQVCTDLPCTWNQNFTTNVTSPSANNIMFYIGEVKEKLSSANTSSKVVNPTFTLKEMFL